MFKKLFKKNKTDLSQRCLDYLNEDPPVHMKDYVPESITEIIISYGAQKEPLTDELTEIANIILMESNGFDDIEDVEIKKYMENGGELVREVLESQ